MADISLNCDLDLGCDFISDGDLTQGTGITWTNYDGTVAIDGDIVINGTYVGGTGQNTYNSFEATSTASVTFSSHASGTTLDDENGSNYILLLDAGCTVTPNNETIILTHGDCLLKTNSNSIYNLIMNVTGTIELGSDLIIGNDFTCTVGTLTSDGYDIEVGGSPSISGIVNVNDGAFFTADGDTIVNSGGEFKLGNATAEFRLLLGKTYTLNGYDNFVYVGTKIISSVVYRYWMRSAGFTIVDAELVQPQLVNRGLID